MDPRLKAYQKQARPSSAPPEGPPADDPVPVVRQAQLPQFDPPPLVKTTKAPRPAAPKTPVPGPGAVGDKSLRKVAKFLILLGKDEAAKVVRHLEPSQIEALGREIAGIKAIEPVEAEALLEEFGYLAQAQTQAVRGGQGAAKDILARAFGADQAQAILKKSVPKAEVKPFTFLADLEAPVVQALLGSESPQVLSVVVPFLPQAQAAAFLKTLDPALRVDLVRRLAKMEKVPRTVVAQVEQALQQRWHHLTPVQSDAIDGQSRLADILRHLPAHHEEALLKSLGKSSPDLTETLRKKLFTEADLVRVDDGAFEDLLREKTDPQLALLWLAGEAPLKEKIKNNISSRRWLLVEAETVLAEDVTRRDLARELRFFVDEVRQAVRDGRAALLDGTEEYL